jgi:hypothetical protein
MALSEAQSQRVSLTIGQRLRSPCPLCGQANPWTWGPDPIVLVAQRYETAPDISALAAILGTKTSSQLALEALASLGISAGTPMMPVAASTQAYPLLPVICRNCGNTVLLNIYTLGLQDLWPAIANAKAK